MKMDALVTIYVLIYRDIKRLPELLESIVNQTYKRIELLISDDGSTNITKEELEELVSSYSRRFEKLIINKNEENVGTVRHINGIIPKMNGDILVGIAADDVFYDCYVIEKIVDFFENNADIDIVTSKRFDESGGIEQPVKCVQEILKNNFEKYKRVMFRATPLISGAGTFFRKGLFEKYGYFPEEFKLVEDASYFTRLISQGVKFGFLDKITVFHGAGGVSDRHALPHPWYVEDMDYLYSAWLYNLIEKNDKFSYRCVTYHQKRRKVKNKRQLVILYLQYIDVCVWLFLFYKMICIG